MKSLPYNPLLPRGRPDPGIDPTAAGNIDAVEAGDGGGGHTSVVLDLTAQIVEANSGFPTEGLGVAFDAVDEREGADESVTSLTTTVGIAAIRPLLS